MSSDDFVVSSRSVAIHHFLLYAIVAQWMSSDDGSPGRSAEVARSQTIVLSGAANDGAVPSVTAQATATGTARRRMGFPDRPDGWVGAPEPFAACPG